MFYHRRNREQETEKEFDSEMNRMCSPQRHKETEKKETEKEFDSGMNESQKNRITGQILDCCIEVHRHLGPGLMESTYEMCLMREFELREIRFTSQVTLPVWYKGVTMQQGYKIDLLVEDEFIMELKSVDAILPVHKAQLITYLKLMDKRVGFLVNFNVSLLKNGFQRIIHGYDEEKLAIK